jgi:hypothetical protein
MCVPPTSTIRILRLLDPVFFIVHLTAAVDQFFLDACRDGLPRSEFAFKSSPDSFQFPDLPCLQWRNCWNIAITATEALAI